MSGRYSRNKGSRGEREIVHLGQKHGIGTERVPLSGALGGKYKSDINMPLLGRDVTLQAKWEGDGFKRIYEWLQKEGDYGLCLRADQKPWLIVLRLEDFFELARLSDEFRTQFELPSHEARP